MMECFSSPTSTNDMHFGMKRSRSFVSENAENGTDICFSNVQSQKRLRYEGDSSSIFTTQSELQHNSVGEKRQRITAVTSSRQHDQLKPLTDSNLGSFNTNNEIFKITNSFQAALTKKECELSELRNVNQKLENDLSNFRFETSSALEENKILKRAVAIHDSRYKELINQNQKLQVVLSQAGEHITNLERANQQLKLQLQSINNNSFSSNFDNTFHQRPPDVF